MNADFTSRRFECGAATVLATGDWIRIDARSRGSAKERPPPAAPPTPAQGVPAPAPTAPASAPAEDAESRLARRHRILIHDDDVTPMDFVVQVLIGIHRLDAERAVEVMLEAHHTGCALVRRLGLEEAEFRVAESHAAARARGFPLTFSVEPE
jgi:ATP-dependent Clp protease adaptor protein ClpS